MRRWNIAIAAVPVALFVFLLAVTWNMEGVWFPREESGEVQRLCVVLLPLIVAGVVYDLRERWQARIGAGWPVAEATILKSEASHGWGARGCKAEIEYAFEVGGRSYTGSYLEYFDNLYGEPEKVVAPFPAGAKVPVHFNPNDPAVSVFELSAGLARKRLKWGVASIVVLLLFALWVRWASGAL